MMTLEKKAFHITALVLFTFVCIGTLASHAQEKKDEEVKSLGDILNKPIDYGNNGKPLTSAIMANHYYGVCANKKSLVFDKDEKEILCGCNAAKMSEILSVKEFKDLTKKTKRGKDARGRMLAHAYAPCMEYVVEKKVKTDCFKAGKLRDLVSGKVAICKCVVDNFKKYVTQNASFIIMDAIHNEPMTMDPLEYFFVNKNYHAQHSSFLRTCRYEIEYKRDN